MEYGLIGSRLGHSYSKIIHEKICNYRYELHPLPTEQEFHAFMQAHEFKAINVTIPYKQMVIPYCDEVDEGAKAIGAVNTIVNRDGKLYGYNTDFGGVVYTLQKHEIEVKDKNVLILGTGGTHNTVTAVCRHLGAKRIDTVSRRGGEGLLTYEEAMAKKDVQVLINTTPCGMYPNVGECLIDLSGFEQLEAVMDVVYNPFRTELILRAEEKGIKAVGGFEMLVAQAVLAAEWFLGTPMDRELIGKVHSELKLQLCNISVIGMPSVGKSTIGRRLAKKLGKSFVDLDWLMESRTGMTIPEIFEKEGEAGFRKREAELAAEVGKEGGKVIGCGGGIITTPGNAHSLRQNGPVLWVQRPLEALSVGGNRPLSKSREALAEMQKKRYPLYEAAADCILQNDGKLEAAVEKAAELVQQAL